MKDRRLFAAASAFLLCYASVAWTILGIWSTHPLYSYGFAVPLISGYVLLAKRNQLREFRPSPDYLFGVCATVLGLALLLAGRLGAILAAQQLSLVVTLVGFLLLLFGRRMVRIVAFPLLYLMIGIPIWDRLIQGLQTPSQMLSGTIALQVFRSVGIPALREGTSLVLPNVTLEVLRECSGVNQLIAVFAMSVPAAYLWLVGSAKRTALVVFALSVAYLSNGFRIAMVGFLSYNGFARGDIRWLHLFEGLATSLVGYSLILACLMILSRSNRHTAGPAPLDAMGAGVHQASRFNRSRPGLEIGIVSLTVLVGAFVATYHPGEVVLSRELHTLPTQVGSWVQAPADAGAPGYRLRGADDELDRTYRRPSGERLRVYIGYQKSERQGNELASADSWELARAASFVDMALDSEVVRLNELTQSEGAARRGKFFWFDVHGRTIASWYFAKAYLVWTALTQGHTNGAVVLVEWEAHTDAEFKERRREAVDFVRLLRPHLADCMPL